MIKKGRKASSYSAPVDINKLSQKDYEDFLEFIKENDNGLDEEGEQICKIRSEYKLPCRNCIHG